ncbi:alpha/beta fold hydrolase [Actinomadura sp. HBU206391]|uniref:alpha/beta fold hydrolase n=1 Tax=Actinomadura sp. HBU206391 TaxID=2731692 RepID=UPI00164F7979|nr:alpha/beta hydrolase [Actinomadura sp. HBU206391]MBC6456649.1 alpha/beta hydrolase [Actinomadura sp. HBU206391]
MTDTAGTTSTVGTALGPVVVTVRGAGTPVLLLHANPGDGRDYAAVVPALAERHTTYTVDWPGYGNSPAPPQPGTTTAMAYAGILPAVVAGLGLRRTALIGNSVGGYAAARLAITHPEAVTALILVNSGGFTRHNPLTRAVARLKGTETMTRALVGRLPRLYLRERTPVVQEMLARDQARRGDRVGIAVEAAIWRSFTNAEHDLRSRAAQITAPTLLLWGTRDPLLGQDGRSARRSIPHATWHPLPTGHAPFAEDPQAFLAAVRPFLDRPEPHTPGASSR